MFSPKVKKWGFPSFRRKPESRVSCENRNPVSKMFPCFRRDDVWTPVSTGVTTFYEITIFACRGDPCPALVFSNISVISVPSVAKVFWLRLCRAVLLTFKFFKFCKESPPPSPSPSRGEGREGVISCG